MRGIVVSDTHIGKGSSNIDGIGVLQQASREIADVMLVLGDLGEDIGSLTEGLRILSDSDASHKLYVLGNHCMQILIKYLNLKLGQHYGGIEQFLNGFGFQCLDNEPFKVSNYGFVGSHGGFDGTLWLPTEDCQEIVSASIKHFQEQDFPDSHNGYTPHSFCALNVRRFYDHIMLLQQSSENHVYLIGASHTVPHPKFLSYGVDPRLDRRNYAMGSYHLLGPLQRCEVAFVGHAHNHIASMGQDIVGTIHKACPTADRPYLVFEDTRNGLRVLN